MSNLKYYDKLRTPPDEALKPILAGRLKGKTDISPQWRIQAMTENFGICGIGWKYKITKQWTESGDNGQVFAFMNIDLFIKDGDLWSDSIPGTGGTLLITNEKNGAYSDDEAYKKSLTDALGVAMKALGMGADVYMGKLDNGSGNGDSKYDKKPSNNKYKFGDAKNEKLTWVNDLNIKGMVDSINKGQSIAVIEALQLYRWSNTNKKIIIKALEK